MPTHEHIERLIPWYVNGTLGETEMDTVNRHLTGCSTCRQSIQAELQFARSLRSDPRPLHQVPTADAAWADLADRLPRARARPAGTPVTLLLALTLAIAGASFLAGQQVRPPAYQALIAQIPHDGPVLQIMFEPRTTESAIRRLVRQTGGTVIAGPTAKGVYRLGLPADSDGRAEEARLGTFPAVRWVTLEEP